MMFILNEAIYSGTVVLNNNISGIEAKNFSDAVQKVKKFKSFKEGKSKVIREDENEFIFSIMQEKSTYYNVMGTLKNEELKVYQ